MYRDSIIREVFRQITLNKIVNYYSSKTKTTVKAHLKIKRGKVYASEGILVRHRKRKKFLGFYLELYIYNNNSKLNSKAKKIFDSNGNLLAK